MTTLNEEKNNALNPNLLSENYDKQKNTKTCNERSDSGFSECSSCSTPSTSCVCGGSLEKSADGEKTESKSLATEPLFAGESSAGPLKLVVPTLEMFVAHNPTSKAVTPKNDVVQHVEPSNLETSRHEESTNELEKHKVFLEKTTKKTPTYKHGVEQLKKNSKVAALKEKFEKSDCVSPVPSFHAKSTVARESTGLSTNPMNVLCMTSVYKKDSFFVRILIYFFSIRKLIEHNERNDI